MGSPDRAFAAMAATVFKRREPAIAAAPGGNPAGND
jgi:hypothetical protein